MKKSKVIIPAMAMILFSTAASISGTVAWFTANRTFQTTLGDFQVARLDGNLACGFVAGNGTVASGTAYTGELANTYPTLNVGENIKMTNASWDNTTAGKKLWFTRNPNDGFVNVTTTNSDGGSYAANSTWKHGEFTQSNTTYSYYYAVSWQMKFTYSFAEDITDMDLKFDSSLSSMAKGDVAGQITPSADLTGDDANKNVYKAFRIALYVGSGLGVVFADNQVNANCHYVNATTANANGYHASYTAIGTDIIDSSDNTSAVTLGTLTSAAPTITVNCVAWFEGSDPNINDGVTAAHLANTYSVVKSTLGFKVEAHPAQP